MQSIDILNYVLHYVLCALNCKNYLGPPNCVGFQAWEDNIVHYSWNVFFEAIWLIRDWMTNWWIVYWHSPFFGNSPSFITLPHLWIMVSSMLQVERGTTALSVVRYPTISQFFCQQLVNWWFGGPGGLDLLMSQRLGIPSLKRSHIPFKSRHFWSRWFSELPVWVGYPPGN